MRDDEVLTGSFMEETWLTLEQVAAACAVEPQWLLAHIEAGEFPPPARAAGLWRFSSACLLRARRMPQIESDFEPAPARRQTGATARAAGATHTPVAPSSTPPANPLMPSRIATSNRVCRRLAAA